MGSLELPRALPAAFLHSRGAVAAQKSWSAPESRPRPIGVLTAGGRGRELKVEN